VCTYSLFPEVLGPFPVTAYDQPLRLLLMTPPVELAWERSGSRRVQQRWSIRGSERALESVKKAMSMMARPALPRPGGPTCPDQLVEAPHIVAVEAILCLRICKPVASPEDRKFSFGG